MKDHPALKHELANRAFLVRMLGRLVPRASLTSSGDPMNPRYLAPLVAMTFTLDYAEWETKGIRCKEKPSEVRDWLGDHH